MSVLRLHKSGFFKSKNLPYDPHRKCQVMAVALLAMVINSASRRVQGSFQPTLSKRTCSCPLRVTRVDFMALF